MHKIVIVSPQDIFPIDFSIEVDMTAKFNTTVKKKIFWNFYRHFNFVYKT